MREQILINCYCTGKVLFHFNEDFVSLQHYSVLSHGVLQATIQLASIWPAH
jgi:hypothetical protein